MCLIKMILVKTANLESWGLVFILACFSLGTLSALVQTMTGSAW